MFCINQYNEAVHAKGVNKIIMGRGTKSDIVFFEQLGRSLRATLNKEELFSPTIIDLAGNIEFIKILQNSLKSRIKEIETKNERSTIKREIKIKDIDFDIEILNQDLLDILIALKERLTPKTWEEWFEIAKEYYEVHGNLLVKMDYQTELQENLGIWINNQRQAYQNRFLPKEKRNNRYLLLTDEQVLKLENIGMVWDPHEYQWNKMYELTKLYYLEHGNLRIPYNYKTASGETLGLWISTQRKCYQNSFLPKEKRNNSYTPLTYDQVLKLESIGMIWDVYEYQWNMMCKLAKSYYLKYGNLLVPTSYKTPSGEALGTWIITQRKAYKNRFLPKEKRNNRYILLTDEQVKKLESIGMVWDINEYQWNKMYELARLYYLEHGNLQIPFRYKTPSGDALGNWLSTQRQAYKNRFLSKEKGNSSHTLLPDEQIEKLENIGMVWDSREYQWSKMYELAKSYYLEYGNLLISYNYKTPSGDALGTWISTQRLAYQNCFLPKEIKKNAFAPLTSDQVLKLESIGMVWDVQEYQWNKMYELAKSYYLEHGNLLVPANYKTAISELGKWIQNQRQAYKNRFLTQERQKNAPAPLTNDQVLKLESIGMIWDCKKNKERNIELCIMNNIDYKKCPNLINSCSSKELEAKIIFLKEQNIIPLDEETYYELLSSSYLEMPEKISNIMRGQARKKLLYN